MSPFLALALFIAAPLFQDEARERVKTAVGTYISPRTKVEERARIVERLGAMGPASVGFVHGIADANGGFAPTRFLAGEVKIDQLRRLGDELGAQALTRLRAQMGTVDVTERSLESILDMLRRQGLALVLINPAEQEEIARLRFSVRASNEGMDVILDRMLPKHRLDYYARGGVVVIASRGWLWGPPPAGAAEAAVQERVTEALGQLDAELLDRRVAAERTIIDAGLGVIPIVEKEQERAKGARKDRLAMLVDRIFARHVPDRLHPPGAEPGLLSEDANDALVTAKDRMISISFFRPTPLSEIIARIAEFSEMPAVLDAAIPAEISAKKLTLAVDDATVHAVLEALVIPLGAAVRPEGGRLLIAPRR